MRDYTDITILLDESGSMGPLRDDTIGGFNTTIEDQRREKGEAVLSVFAFNNRRRAILRNANLHFPTADIRLNRDNYSPNGATALHDTLCQCIDQKGAELAILPEAERPSKVLFIIITDGKDTSSRHYRKQDAQRRIRTQTDVYNWTFVFIGANLDAYKEAATLGIPVTNTMQFDATGEGTHRYTKKMSDGMSKLRSCDLDSLKGLAFFDGDEDANALKPDPQCPTAG